MAPIHLFLLLLLASGLEAAADGIACAVHLRVAQAPIDPHRPWSRLPPRLIEGNGAVVANQRIVTAAALVAGAARIEVRASGSTIVATARVEALAPYRGLAVLAVDDPAVLAETQPLAPARRLVAGSQVAVIGHLDASNGTILAWRQLSGSVGLAAAAGGPPLPRGRLDAPLAQALVGAPVLVDRNLAGILVPPPTPPEAGTPAPVLVPAAIVAHLLADLADGRHDGMPALGVTTQPLLTAAAKRAVGLPVQRSGVVVRRVGEHTAATGHLLRDDVLLAIEGRPIDDRGMVVGADGNHHHFSVLAHLHHPGDPVLLRVWRLGREQEVTVPLTAPPPPLIPDRQTPADHLLVAGVLMRELSHELLAAGVGQGVDRTVQPGRRRLVFVQRVYPDDVNRGHHDLTDWTVTTAAGQPLRDLAHLRAILSGHTEGDLVLSGLDDRVLALELTAARAGDAAVRERYGLPLVNPPPAAP